MFESEEDALPLCFAVIADPMEEADEDGSRDWEILETEVTGFLREGMLFFPFPSFEELLVFIDSLRDYVAKMADGSMELMEALEDELDA